MRRGKNRGKGSLLSEIMLWISLERPSVFRLAWRLADDRGRWSWKRVINKHFNRAGERCRQASGHGPSGGSLAPLQVKLQEQSATHHHCTVCICVCDREGETEERPEKVECVCCYSSKHLKASRTSMHREY